jgi:hypothetical protein
LRRYAILLNLTLAACLLTPMLPGLIRTTRNYQSDDPVLAAPVIAETQPIWHGPPGNFWTPVALLNDTILLAAALCLICNGRRLRMGETIWLAASALLLLKMGRFSPLFVLIAAPVLAATLPRFSGRTLGRPAMIALLAGMLAAGSWEICRRFPPPAMSLDAWLNRHGPEIPGGYPTDAAAYVERQIPRVHGNIINEFPWGGYLAWRLNGQFKILIDGRTQVYPPDVWQSLYLGSSQERQAYLKTLNADAAILPLGKSLFHDALIHCGWTSSKYHDPQGRAEVLVPPQKQK